MPKAPLPLALAHVVTLIHDHWHDQSMAQKLGACFLSFFPYNYPSIAWACATKK
jgi:hypothetical protein